MSGLISYRYLRGSIMRLTQRSILFTILATGSFGATLIAIYYVIVVRDMRISAIIFANATTGWALTYSYWRGWEPARYLGAAACILANVAALFVSDPPLSLGMLLSPIIILILAGSRWLVVNSFIILALGLILRSESFSQPIEIGYYIAVIVGLLIVQLMVSVALRDARENAQAAEEARHLTQQQLQENTLQAQQLQAQNQEQRQLLDLVDTLEMPTVSLADGVILAPLVGTLDTRRFERLTERLLKHVHTERARLVILDLTGVPIVDTAVAKSIDQTIQALQLLGCRVVVTGISAQIASTLAERGISFAHVEVARSPHEAIAALGQLS